MADLKISTCTELAAQPAADDLAVIVDISDTTMAASGTDKKIQYSNLMGGAWTSWTPTWVNLSGGTLNYAKYVLIGKTVHFRIKYTLGATGGVAGAVTFTTPTTINSDLTAVQEVVSGNAGLTDTGTATYRGGLRWGSSTTLKLEAMAVAGSYISYLLLSSTVPHTWAETDIITIVGTYESA